MRGEWAVISPFRSSARRERYSALPHVTAGHGVRKRMIGAGCWHMGPAGMLLTARTMADRGGRLLGVGGSLALGLDGLPGEMGELEQRVAVTVGQVLQLLQVLPGQE